jgi:hypothetical protein
MQFTTLVISSFIGLAAATSSAAELAAQLPACSDSCLSAAATAVDCGSTDYLCQCDNMDAYVSNATSCISTSCSVSDIGSTSKLVTKICAAEGTSATSNSTTSKGTTSSSSSTSSSTPSKAANAAGRVQLAGGLGWAAVAGVVGYLAM